MNIKRSNMMLPSGRGAKSPTGGNGGGACSGGRCDEGGKMKYMGGGRYEGASVDDSSTGRGYAKGGKNPFYKNGGMTPGGSDVQKLLQMLANYDQNAPIGEFMQILAEMGGQGGAGEAAAAGAGKMAGSAMTNLPPRDVESLLMQLGQQGR